VAAQAAAQGAGRTAAGQPQEASVARGELVGLITELTEQMHAAAAELQFEIAARLRDEIRELKHELRGMHAAGV
jgi:excinuclease ABC subunit B